MPIYDMDKFPKVTDLLKNNLCNIKSEFENLAALNVSSDYTVKPDEHLLHDGMWDWASYILKGNKQQHFVNVCPETTKVIDSIPRIMKSTPFGFSFFSSLKAGATIKSHNGPCNLRLRCHFPLIVPAGDCGMRVGDKVIRWEVGKPIIFDDCYEHEVWNNTNQTRVILLFDVW